MITKYNMASGEITYQSKLENGAASKTSPRELIDMITSLQLVEIEVKPVSKSIPVDILSISASEFLRRQG